MMASPVTIDVSRAIDSYRRGSTKEHDILVSQLVNTHLQNDTLATYLKALKHCMAVLGQDFEVLIAVVLKLDWPRCGCASVIKEYQSFVLNLVSAHTCYLRACIRMAMLLFQPKSDKLEIMDETRRADEQIFIHVHTLLKAIIHTVPMTPSILMPLLHDCAPYQTRSAYIQRCFASNLLHIAGYLPGKRGQILEILLDNMLKLDVRSPRHVIQAAEDEANRDDSDDDNNNGDALFAMDEDMTVDKTEMKHGQADRLDVLMDLMFTYVHTVCYTDGVLNWEATKKLYRELLVIFQQILLTTHASCHVQFLMFYICSFREALCEGFLDYLWKKVQNPNTEAVYRQAAVAYIASMLARAKYIATSTVKACLDLMVPWIHMYINEATYTTSRSYYKHHPAFFSTCQAVFYVFIFRHKDLLAMKNGYKYCQSLNLQTIVTCRLNPLRMCLSLVAKTFASITRMHQLVFCDTILEHNKRTSLLMMNGVASSEDAILNPLDSFFPFDPYLLHRSARFVTDLYQEYEGAEHLQLDMEDSDHEEADHYSDTPSTSLDRHTPGSSTVHRIEPSPTDLLMYGISPGFQAGTPGFQAGMPV